MTSFKDLVSVAGSSHARRAAGGDNDALTSAWLVHQHMLGKAQREHAPEIPSAEDGAVWLLYRGTAAAAVIELGLADASDTDAYRDKRRDVTRVLRRLMTAVCVHRTNGKPGEHTDRTSTVWAIRTEFREVPPADDPPITRMVWDYVKQFPVFPEEPALKSSPAENGDGGGSNKSFGTSDGLLDCPACHSTFAAMHLGRHYFSAHADPVPLMLEAIRQRGEMLSSELAKLLSEVAGGCVITTSFVNGKMDGPRRDKTVITQRGHHGAFWYLLPRPVNGHPAREVREEPGSDRGEGNVYREAQNTGREALLTAPPAEEPAREEPVKVREEPSELLPGNSGEDEKLLLSNISAEKSSSQSPAPAGDELDAALADLAQAARRVSAVADRMRGENAKLAAYRDRVRHLLESAE